MGDRKACLSCLPQTTEWRGSPSLPCSLPPLPHLLIHCLDWKRKRSNRKYRECWAGTVREWKEQRLAYDWLWGQHLAYHLPHHMARSSEALESQISTSPHPVTGCCQVALVPTRLGNVPNGHFPAAACMISCMFKYWTPLATCFSKGAASQMQTPLTQSMPLYICIDLVCWLTWIQVDCIFAEPSGKQTMVESNLFLNVRSCFVLWVC